MVSEQPGGADDSGDIENVVSTYVPVAKRRAQLRDKLQSKRVRTTQDIQREAEQKLQEEADEERQREKARRERTLLQQAQEVKERKAKEGW